MRATTKGRTMANPAEPKVAADWERIEVDYRAGVKTLRQIAEEHGISHAAVNKRAKRDGWSRDLNAKIQAAAEAKVSKAAVTSQVSVDTKLAEKAVIEANAEAIYRIRMEHRRVAGQFQKLTQAMAAELESMTGNPALFQQLGEMFDAGPDGKGRDDKLNEAYHRVIAMPGRVDHMRKLVETFERLVKLERQAFGLDNPMEKPPEVPDTPALTNDLARRVAFVLARGLQAQKETS